MRIGRGAWARARAVVVVIAAGLGLVGLVAWGQAQPGQGQGKARAPQADGKGAAKPKKPGGVRVPVGVPPKGKGKARRGDPVAKAAGDEVTVVIQFQLGTDNGDDLAATYYRSDKGDTAPVVLLIHDKGRQGRDFEEPISELEGKSLAEKLRQDGYAVLILDLRGHGANPRPAKELGPKDWQAMTADLESAYTFLLDRHNHRELNLAKFAAIGLGTGANLLAHWAARPDAAIAAIPPGTGSRPSDLAAVVLISPLADAQGMKLETSLPLFASRLPALVVVGDKDAPSYDAVKAQQKVIERNRLSKIAYVENSPLASHQLLRFGPKVTEPLLRFLDGTVKLRRDEWEGRYNLDPVSYRDARLVTKTKPADKDKKAADKDKEKDKEKDAAKDKAEPKPDPAPAKKNADKP